MMNKPVWSGVGCALFSVLAVVAGNATAVAAMQLTPTVQGLEVSLDVDMTTGDRPQVFTLRRDNVWTADIINVALNDSTPTQWIDPAPGIQSVTVTSLDTNSIRISVAGYDQAPIGSILNDRPVLTFALQASSESDPATEVSDPMDVLVPNPDIYIQTTSTSSPSRNLGVPPLAPRAIAPPIGDIAVSTGMFQPPTIDLGTNERIPRLVLRDAPVRDVLSLLARAANLNLAYADPQIEEEEQPEEITVSLDIENEPIQSVFDTVLAMSGLEAHRRGQTIFAGPQLPSTLGHQLVRTLRMNQVPISTALSYLVGLGAESSISRERLVTSINAIPVELPDEVVSDQAAFTQSQTTLEERIESQRVSYVDTNPPLRGLLALGDERTNAITLVGPPQQVDFAVNQLSLLDVRQRQVAVNIRIIDVDLSAMEEFNASFSFGINDTFIERDNSGFSVAFDNQPNANPFEALLEAEVESGNAKILTDPTLIVQEGQVATVALTEEVPTTTGETTFDENGEAITFEQDDPRAAGLTLAIQVDRIDDNGFVSLSVAPTITAPSGEQENPDGSVTTLLSARSLQSGQIRLRDGQTLILTGIIQDSDRVTVSKVPLLGDIPILGALFRDTERENERREVVILLTPQILNDSDVSDFGYGYIPSLPVQEIIRP